MAFHPRQGRCLPFSVSVEAGRDQSLAPVDRGPLGLQFVAPVTGELERDRFLKTTSSVEPADQDQNRLQVTSKS